MGEEGNELDLPAHPVPKEKFRLNIWKTFITIHEQSPVNFEELRGTRGWLNSSCFKFGF
jgi:hypothetical protein